MASGRKLRYSERKRLAETGNLGELVHDVVPDGLRRAVATLITRSTRDGSPDGKKLIFLHRLAERYHLLADAPPEGELWDFFFVTDTDGFLDLVEIAVDVS